ncbi:hypothetical protein E2C01_037500 [Portunus trituberculatus]|uniref:Uncharacterized protein n=1 Tax=Portunus trituberculatus TaxID=210409 RepID=A0A5B7FES3_PORTR|nr:hypothetical protein [Portunus trituberculatus]
MSRCSLSAHTCTEHLCTRDSLVLLALTLRTRHHDRRSRRWRAAGGSLTTRSPGSGRQAGDEAPRSADVN